MQPRPGTSSTVSTGCVLAPATRHALISELKTRTCRTPFRRWIWPRAASARFSQGAHRLACIERAPSCDVARLTRAMHAIGFCHLLLQSRALVSRSFSMRSRLAPADYFGFRSAARPERSCLPVGRTIEHPAVSRRRGGSGGSTRLDACFTSPAWSAFSSALPVVDRPSVVPVAPSRCASLRIPPQRPTPRDCA